MRHLVASLLLVSLVADYRQALTASEPNQRTPSTSPSGKFILTVLIENDPTERDLPFWRVTISAPTGKKLFKDDSKFIGTLNVYWCWDRSDRVWLYNSDDGNTYVWQIVESGQWQRSHVTAIIPLAPPPELYPEYVKKK